MTINVGIIGAAGLSGLELIHILNNHPQADLKLVTSSKFAGKTVESCFPQFVGIKQVFQPNDTVVDNCDVVFLAIPNKASLSIVPQLINKGIKVIDLSGVYRLRDTEVFRKYYKLEHTSPELLNEAVFGLPEFFKDKIKNARLIANPGCYPTGSLLGILPFGDLLKSLDRPPIFDAKSGVTGAGGRVEDDTTNYVTVNENFKAYRVFCHQHLPEICQYLEELTPYRKEKQGQVIFTPYLLPLNRGILTTIYLHFEKSLSPELVRNEFVNLAVNNPFMRILPEGVLPELKHVQNSNRCSIGIVCDETQKDWVVITAIDNLVKGAAGQAIQNMNIMFNLDETMALI